MAVEQLFLGDLFDALRDKLGRDDQALATFLGLPQGTMFAMSSYQVSPAQARQLCELFGLDFEDLLSRLNLTDSSPSGRVQDGRSRPASVGELGAALHENRIGRRCATEPEMERGSSLTRVAETPSQASEKRQVTTLLRACGSADHAVANWSAAPAEHWLLSSCREVARLFHLSRWIGGGFQ